jgi:hypothetical protein
MNTDQFRALAATVAKEDAERAAEAVLSRANRLWAQGYLSNTSLLTLNQCLASMGLWAVLMMIILYKRPNSGLHIFISSFCLVSILMPLCFGLPA